MADDSRVAAASVGEGSVPSVAHPEDARSHLVQLTSRGDAHWREGWPALEKTVAQVAANLERPVDDVQDALEDLVSALRKASSASTPVS